MRRGAGSMGRHQQQRGFTLIELLVALVILGLLVGLVGPRVMKYVGGAKSDTTRIQIEDMVTALDMYSLEVGHYPSQNQGLESLIMEPSGVDGWNGPYLRKQVVPKDPWGQEYHYRHPGEHGPFDIFSYGADNSPGGEKDNADIGSWE